MIHYHGTPFGGTRVDVERFLAGRHAFVPWQRAEDLQCVQDVCQSFAIDNSAFSHWQQGDVPDWDQFYQWLTLTIKHPALDWVVIPDVIDGTEDDNDRLIDDWPFGSHGIPVWHLHESIERLEHLANNWPRIGIGSSGEWAVIGTDNWWRRMGEAMRACCDDSGRPVTKLHGFRMLDPAVFGKFPFASADSTNVARNASSLERFGCYCPPMKWQRAESIARRIESVQSPAVWSPNSIQCQGSLF